MSEDTLEPGSLEFKMNAAVLSMNRKLRDHGYSERERAAMWEMTVSEMREFLTKVWEHNNNDPQHIESLSESSVRAKKAEQDAQIDKLHGSGAAAALEAAIADGSVFSDSSRDEEYPENWEPCVCGAMKVAPGTRTEIASVSHGEASCFPCNDKGQPIVKEETIEQRQVSALERGMPTDQVALIGQEPKPTPPKPGPPVKSAQTNN